MPGSSSRALVALLLLALSGRADAAEPACPRRGDAIVVFTAAHELWLCERGEAVARFSVALGRGGTGKRRMGDGRTPLGTYPAGEPRPSRRFGTFIPIGYPTVQQAAQGFTGSQVGIHGPPRGMEAARVTTEVDWTQGCIATATDEEIAAIALFVAELRPPVLIR